MTEPAEDLDEGMARLVEMGRRLEAWAWRVDWSRAWFEIGWAASEDIEAGVVR